MRECYCDYEPEGFGLSTDPVERAIERIEALVERGEDPINGTLRRIAATEDPGKIAGIYLAATTSSCMESCSESGSSEVPSHNGQED